jgi:hypothetical protein
MGICKTRAFTAALAVSVGTALFAPAGCRLKPLRSWGNRAPRPTASLQICAIH